MTIKAILTDIEGTTSSIEFVHQVLFPYAKAKIASFVEKNKHKEHVLEQINLVKERVGQPDMDLAEVIETLLNWIEQDKKEPALKQLQGLIWSEGYKNADFTGHLYSDAYLKLKHWHENKIALYVYSSGSVHAQRLLFGYSDFGDITNLFNDYFDTTIGHKREVNSYKTIAERIQLKPDSILFLSDIVEELDAAQAAGFKVMQLVRNDKVITAKHQQVNDFTSINVSEI